jgi:quercetin dioxygenase-like cupin family protein
MTGARRPGNSPLVRHEHEVDAESWNDATRGELSFRTLLGGPGSETDRFTAGVADLGPGQWLGVHSHQQDEIYYVLQGELLLQLGSAEHPLRAGHAVVIPGGVRHGVRHVRGAPARLFYALAAGSFDEVQYSFAE